jgi:hypothetical protein
VHQDALSVRGLRYMRSTCGDALFEKEEEKTRISLEFDRNPGRTIAKALFAQPSDTPSGCNESARSGRHMPQRFTHFALSQQAEISVYRCLFLELGELVQIHLLDYWDWPIGIFGQLVDRGTVLARDRHCYNQQIR